MLEDAAGVGIAQISAHPYLATHIELILSLLAKYCPYRACQQHEYEYSLFQFAVVIVQNH